mgnify:CR=1 FL=1
MVEFCCSVDTTGTSYKDFSLIFRIEVKENLTLEESRLKSHSTVKTGLLRSCKEALDLTCREIAVKNCELSSHTDATVSSKSCVRSDHPSVLYNISDRILCKVMLNTLILLTNHI